MAHCSKTIFTALSLLIVFSTVAQRPDILIKNGRILDGTGNSWYYADVAISAGKIIRIGNFKDAVARKIIDAKGLIVAPGFIDVHTHIEGNIFRNPTANNFILDGVTSVVTGNCGASAVDLAAYFKRIDSAKPSINIASLIGHNSVRKQVMGSANRNATDTEVAGMQRLIAKAMEDGAVGFSTGLIYIPGTYSTTEEITTLAKVAAGYNGVYVTHMRDEGDSVLFAIDEALTIGRNANIPVQISHFKVSGQQNWGQSKLSLQKIIDARKEGLDVTIDQYPYTASSTGLSILLPGELLADGNDSIVARLNRPSTKQHAIDHMLKNLKKRNLQHFSYAVVASHTADTTYNGKSIEEINLMKGREHNEHEEAETIIDLVKNGGAGAVFHGMSEEDVQRIMLYPFNMFASDAGISLFGQGVPHPRGYGTNARILARYVREQKLFTLEDAIRRMTSLPAQKFGLKDRGLLKEGFAADIVILDEKEVADLSTFKQPHQYSKGYKWVIVNGKVVVEEGVHTGMRSGRVLRLR